MQKPPATNLINIDSEYHANSSNEYEGWVGSQQLGLLYDYDNCVQPTALKLVTLTPTPTLSSGATSVPTGINTCKITLSSVQNVDLFRAPIEGNPSEEVFQNVNELNINAYAIDPLTNNLWLGLAVTPSDLPLPLAYYIRWVKVRRSLSPLNSNSPFNLQLSNKTVNVPLESDSGANHLYYLILQQSQVVNLFALGGGCGLTLRDESKSLPTSNSIYALPTMLSPAFTWWPMSVFETCKRTSQQFLFGVADDTGKGYPVEPRVHQGSDMFAHAGNLDTPGTGSSVYSVADNGIIVGMGQDIAKNLYSAYWGDYRITEVELNLESAFFRNRLPNMLIVRYGHLYVVYAHMLYIEPFLYVGSVVQSGERLGIIGTYPDSNSHLHIEVRSFGQNISKTRSRKIFILDANNNNIPNQWGIFAANASVSNQTRRDFTPLNIYDFVQFYSTSPTLPGSALAWGTDMQADKAQITGAVGGWDYTTIKYGFPCTITFYSRNQASFGWATNWSSLSYRLFVYTYSWRQGAPTPPPLAFPNVQTTVIP